MTEIREPNYEIDLPGEWVEAESPEAGTVVYQEESGPGRVSVTLLGIKPIFAIADPERLLQDYLQHRPQFEKGQRGASFEQSQPISWRSADSFEGAWSGGDPGAGLLVQHRVLLIEGMLADFTYEASWLDESEFAERAATILGSIAISAE